MGDAKDAPPPDGEYRVTSTSHHEEGFDWPTVQVLSFSLFKGDVKMWSKEVRFDYSTNDADAVLRGDYVVLEEVEMQDEAMGTWISTAYLLTGERASEEAIERLRDDCWAHKGLYERGRRGRRRGK